MEIKGRAATSKVRGFFPIIFLAVAVATISIAVVLANLEENGKKAGAGSDVTNSKKRGGSSYIPSVGSIARLDNGASHTLAGADKEAWDELARAVAAKDDIGWNLLILSGRALLVERGTRVRVLQIKGWSREAEVRILEGKYVVRKAWVSTEFLKAPRQ